ncbi:AcrR family transcriptional regulator [Saccharothrix tamanrassetensis]|uniref:AcrR family transcriptional regulator n=1 Tax=Saccharothrix tamanrassetensis TaxID=1051531 RepID=A0A841CBW3_9PSEU|nr:TetR/AcrR family transcriptional regulator [Saccharothrix tamanrassetensis]MBB5953495.1 AcrR family transcriptional regulator [Saccharothrix tamanrassetensis]
MASVRERLLEAAAELIAEKGWGAVSTRVLADRASVGSGVVHYHFDSTQAVLVQASVGALRAALAGLPDVLESSSTPDQALDALLTALDDAGGRELFTETFLAATRNDELRQAVGAVLAEFRQVLASWLASHGVPTPEQTAAVLAAAIDGLLLHRALDPDLSRAFVVPVLGRVLR